MYILFAIIYAKLNVPTDEEHCQKQCNFKPIMYDRFFVAIYSNQSNSEQQKIRNKTDSVENVIDNTP